MDGYKVYGLQIWDAVRGEPIAGKRLDNLTDPFYAMTFSPDGTTLAIASGLADCDAANASKGCTRIRLWALDDARQSATLVIPATNSGIGSLVYSPDGKRLAATIGTDLRISDSRDWANVTTIAQPNGLSDFAYSPDGTLLAIAGAGDDITLWSASGVRLATLTGHAGAVRGLKFAPDGRTLYSASMDGTVRAWRVDAQ